MTRLLLLLLLLIPSAANSQQTSEWLSGSVKFDLPRKFSFEMTEETRIINNSIGIYIYFSEFQLEYKLTTWLDVSMKYRMSWAKEENMYFYSRKKYFADITLNLPVDRLKIENRIRYTQKTKSYISDADDLYADKHIRNKCSVKYNIRKSPLTPILSTEIFFPVGAYNNYPIDQYRLAIDTKISLANKQSVKTGIMYLNKLGYGPQGSTFIFRLEYRFSFKIKA